MEKRRFRLPTPKPEKTPKQAPPAASMIAGAFCEVTAESGASNGLSMDVRLSPKHRCLRCLRARLGNAIFKSVATYAPMTCMPALTDSELEGIGKAIRANTHNQIQHGLAPHIDRPTRASLKVSAYALAEAHKPQMTRQTRLDANREIQRRSLKTIRRDSKAEIVITEARCLASTIRPARRLRGGRHPEFVQNKTCLKKRRREPVAL